MDRAIHSTEEHDERAVIVEYDGGLDRKTAEELAKGDENERRNDTAGHVCNERGK